MAAEKSHFQIVRFRALSEHRWERIIAHLDYVKIEHQTLFIVYSLHGRSMFVRRLSLLRFILKSIHPTPVGRLHVGKLDEPGPEKA